MRRYLAHWTVVAAAVALTVSALGTAPAYASTKVAVPDCRGFAWLQLQHLRPHVCTLRQTALAGRTEHYR